MMVGVGELVEEVVHVLGHAPGHALLAEGVKAILTGDVLVIDETTAEGVLVMEKVDDLDLVPLHVPALLATMGWMKVLMDARAGVATIAEMHVRLRAVLLPDDEALGHGRVRGLIDSKACVHLIFIYFLYMYVLFCLVRLLHTKLPGLISSVSRCHCVSWSGSI